MRKRNNWKTATFMVAAICLCASATGCGSSKGNNTEETTLAIVAEQGAYEETTEETLNISKQVTVSPKSTTTTTTTTATTTTRSNVSSGTNVTAVHRRSTRSATSSSGSSSNSSSSGRNATYKAYSDNTPPATQPASNTPAQSTKKTTASTVKATTKTTTKTTAVPKATEPAKKTTTKTTSKPATTTKLVTTTEPTTTTKVTTTTTVPETTVATTTEETTTEVTTSNTDITTTDTTVPSTEQESTTTTTVPEETTDPVTTTLIRVEKNVSEDIDLSYALVNGEEFHLDGETSVADYVKLAKMKLALGGSYHDSEILQFRGYMYESVEDIENDKKTKVSLEVINKDGEIIVSDDELRNTPEELFIKGISTSTFFTGEDFTVEFANGLKVGLTQNEIIDKFGEGKVIDDVLLGRISIYNNGTNSIFIMYEKKNNEYVADDIYMFIN